MRYEASGNINLCRNVLNDLDHQSKKFARKGENVEVCSSCKLRERRCMGCLRQVEVVNLEKNAIVVKVCSVPYRKTNYGKPLAQQMVVQSHPCGGLSSYMKSEFRSTELQDSGYPLGA